MKWVKFFKDFGSDQKLPEVKKPVLVQLQSENKSALDPIVLGYLKFAAGDKNSPFFVTPGAGFAGEPFRWCDCLPNEEVWEFFN